MPELLTRGDRVLEPADMAGFKSEWWPVSFRNGGRHQIVTAAGFASEKVAGINRNSHRTCLASGLAGMGFGSTRQRPASWTFGSDYSAWLKA